MNWISVKDQLPEYNKPYFVYSAFRTSPCLPFAVKKYKESEDRDYAYLNCSAKECDCLARITHFMAVEFPEKE